jgi:hypothetical protein
LDKIYYTEKEVLLSIKEWLEKNNKEIDITPFYEMGFKCIYNFCETTKGWVASFEDCCPFCVHYLIESLGSKEDKVKFNKNNRLGKKYNIPLTKKEISLNNKLKKKSKKSNFNKNRKIDYVSRKTLETTLKDMKSIGIPIFGRGKKNLFDDIFQYMNVSSIEDSGMMYVKGLKAQDFIQCLSEDEINDAKIKEIKDQNKKYNLNIKY